MGRNPKQDENLKNGKKTQFQTGEQQAKIARQGGIASGEARRKKKTLKELAQTIGDTPIPDGKVKTQLMATGVAEDDLSWNAAVVVGVRNKAATGDARAAEMWQEWQNIEASEEDTAVDKALAIMRGKFWENVSSNFGGISVDAIKHIHTHYIAFGGRGSTKSSWASLAAVRLIMENPNVHGLVLRKVGNTLRDSVYAQYVWAIGVLGVADYWEAKKNPLDLIYKPTGQRILFRGADDPMKIKSIKVSFGYIGLTHFEELDQFAGESEIRNILQSTMRGGSTFWNFETFNPPISRDNWANKYAAEAQYRDDTVTHHSTYLDLDDPEWLGEQFLNEADLLKARDERAYTHEYLGIAVGTGGNVFDNLEIRDIADDEIRHFDRIYQGVDWGWFPDPYAFIRLHYDKARETIYLIDEKYENKFSNEASAQWIKDSGYNDTWITCDSAEPKSIADYRSMAINAKEAVKGAGSVDYGMKWLQKRKIVIDPRRTPNAYQEFVNYEYEKNKDDEWMSGYPDANNHLIDATRYALERVYKVFGSSA